MKRILRFYFRRITGPDEEITGALMLEVSWRPRKKIGIERVSPIKDIVDNFMKSRRVIFNCPIDNGNNSSPEPAKRKKAKVNG
jgi:hypothetical protein